MNKWVEYMIEYADAFYDLYLPALPPGWAYQCVNYYEGAYWPDYDW